MGSMQNNFYNAINEELAEAHKKRNMLEITYRDKLDKGTMAYLHQKFFSAYSESPIKIYMNPSTCDDLYNWDAHNFSYAGIPIETNSTIPDGTVILTDDKYKMLTAKQQIWQNSELFNRVKNFTLRY